MINTIVDKVKGFLLSPVETFQQSRNDEPGVVFTYFAALLLLNAIFSAFIAAVGIEKMPMYAGMPFGIAVPVMVFFMVLAGGFIVTLLFAAWVHLWVYLLGGRKGIMQTFKAMIYGHTPRLLLGWIPFIGFIFTLWSLVLGILGIRELQEISTSKAILAVAIAIIIPLILLIFLAAYFMTSNMVFTEIPQPRRNIF
ncbi:MAG: Yip1 family protein [Methanoregula sp.]